MWHSNWHGGWHANWHGIAESAVIPPTGPDSVGAFSLDLDNGYTVTYDWRTDVIKTRSGKEQRASRNDQAKETYQGSALLFGTAPAELRSQMARYAAIGATFMLGLPHEELSFTGPASTTTVYVTSTALSDWMNPGQRVILRRDRESVEAVIQSTTSTSITLDVDPGAVGGIGGTIMPAQAIYLEPEQSFPRYATEAERWDVRARAATIGFARARATLALGPLTNTAGFDNATVTERIPGSSPTLVFASGALARAHMVESGSTVTITYAVAGLFPADSGDVYDLLLTSALLVPTGTWGVVDMGGLDVFSAALAGGDVSGPVGTGATVATYDGTPLWDRKLDNDGTISDSIQAMTEVLDFGGIPYSIGSADMADWGRGVSYLGTYGAEWQWFKLFMWTVVGRQKVFWLSTYRDDLPFVSKAAGTITVDADVGAWWPSQRQHVEIEETSGTITRAEVTVGVDNGDGTWTLTIGTTLATSAVERVSWLELCRWTKDEFAVTFDEYGWSVDLAATVVQQ